MKRTNVGDGCLAYSDSMAWMIAHGAAYFCVRVDITDIYSSALVNHYPTRRNECALGQDQFFDTVFDRWRTAPLSSISKHQIFTDYWSENWIRSWQMTVMTTLTSYWIIYCSFRFSSRWIRNTIAYHTKNWEILSRKACLIPRVTSLHCCRLTFSSVPFPNCVDSVSMRCGSSRDKQDKNDVADKQQGNSNRKYRFWNCHWQEPQIEWFTDDNHWCYQTQKLCARFRRCWLKYYCSSQAISDARFDKLFVPVIHADCAIENIPISKTCQTALTNSNDSVKVFWRKIAKLRFKAFTL